MAKETRTLAVIGLGAFGSAVASELARFGNRVIGVDLDERRVAQMAAPLTSAVILDTTDESALREAGMGPRACRCVLVPARPEGPGRAGGGSGATGARLSHPQGGEAADPGEQERQTGGEGDDGEWDGGDGVGVRADRLGGGRIEQRRTVFFRFFWSSAVTRQEFIYNTFLIVILPTFPILENTLLLRSVVQIDA